MNYYTIPKIDNEISLKIHYTSYNSTNTNTSIQIPYLSQSLFFYLASIKEQLTKIQEYCSNQEQTTKVIETEDLQSVVETNDAEQIVEDITIDYINKIVNPFEFIHTIVPGSNIAVSKVKPESNLFFELMELFQIFDINELLQKHKINIGHFTPNHSSSNYFLNTLREDNNDNIMAESFNYEVLFDQLIQNKLTNYFDLFIFEFESSDYDNIDNYIKNMLLVFSLIIKYQNSDGMCIIKIDNVFYKIIVDIIFSLSYLYDKVFVIKPMISDITKGHRYLICKKFTISDEKRAPLFDQIERQIIQNLLIQSTTNYGLLDSILTNDIPYFLINKLNEINMVIGQQQIEAYDQIINMFKNKNRNEKLETLKRNHIQKCIHWCEKNQLPHNKFVDKINIFLTSSKKCSPT